MPHRHHLLIIDAQNDFCDLPADWCPIDPVSFESQQRPNIHVLGDAAIAGAMPKSAFSANAQAKHWAWPVLMVDRV